MKQSRSSFTSAKDAEIAFYTAFTNCDSNAMGKLWADDEVICAHPGSHAIVGYEAVIRSWVYIFTGAEPPDIQVNVVKRILNDTLAVHVVEEHISTGESAFARLLATNVYRKYEKGWLMVEHHGSIIQSETEPRTVQ